MRKYGEIVRLVTGFLNRAKIPYVIVGAVSVSAWGNPRTSRDIDLMIILDSRTIKRFVDFLLRNKFHVELEDIRAALKEKTHFTVFDEKSLYTLDVKGLYTEFDRNTFKRKKKVKLYGRYIWVCSPEDLILSKLMFGSEQDLNDAKSVMVRQAGRLDKVYLEKKVKEMGLKNVYSKIVREIERDLNE